MRIAARCIVGAAVVGAASASASAATSWTTVGGARVLWPLSGPVRTMEPAATLVVEVRRRPAQVSLLRVSRTGVVMRALVRRTVRANHVTIRLPTQFDGRYVLQVRSGDAVRRGTILTTPSVPSPTAGCGAPVTATLTLGRATAHPGEDVTATLANTSDGCALTGEASEWQRAAPDGTWEPVPTPPGLAFSAIGIILRPHGSQTLTARLWNELPPGTYRLTTTVDTLTAAATLSGSTVVASDPLDVTG